MDLRRRWSTWRVLSRVLGRHPGLGLEAVEVGAAARRPGWRPCRGRPRRGRRAGWRARGSRRGGRRRRGRRGRGRRSRAARRRTIALWARARRKMDSRRSLPPRLQWARSASVKVALRSFALVSLAPSSTASPKKAPLALASCRLASSSLAPMNLARWRMLPSNVALRRSVSMKLQSVKSPPERSIPTMSASLKRQRCMVIPRRRSFLRSTPEKSTLGEGGLVDDADPSTMAFRSRTPLSSARVRSRPVEVGPGEGRSARCARRRGSRRGGRPCRRPPW